jgi:Txe/YoeB family toxin of Txe-Axe toxin-antitoxin module
VPPPASASTTPLVAADEDLIEKEWVDKAKEIIQQTKDDPHTRSQKVNELQRDYLQKRYGKVIGASQ